MQLTHYNTEFKKRKFPITLVCDKVTNSPNIGSLFRTADAFGISKLILCGEVNVGRKVTKTSRSTEKTVPYEIHESAATVVENLKQQGVQIIAIEITSQSKALHTYTFDIEKPIAFIVGDENFGVSAEILQIADETLHIEMFGDNSSMNVAQATNIALYEVTKQLV
ncbi:TrmH family RNA methyltransferase [Brumimicrobium aurantiacum]|uniref:TrmH family RNA methyltransferase n=1 Tax=Brumimicrobium aurantiacum TaxID=1737063 RepID=A0A3E1EYL0_9FLAO|nr:TrmH family RNA methyltransferase [Brumimicrobium aurantiacum]RFC54617.1 TrmH family RNA methyltransferase [Brumimicrobium aurantiacum]